MPSKQHRRSVLKPARPRPASRRAKRGATGRLEARIPIELQEQLRQAAALVGRSVTDYVIAAVENATRRTLEETTIIRLSAEDSRRFAEALLNPPAPNEALVRAAERRRRLIAE